MTLRILHGTRSTPISVVRLGEGLYVTEGADGTHELTTTPTAYGDQTPGGGATTVDVTATAGADLRDVGDSVEIPIDDSYTIVEAEIIGAASGNAVVDVLRATDAGFPTFASIAASSKPTLSAQRRVKDSTLTGWNTALSAGDTLRFTWSSGDVGSVVVALKLSRTVALVLESRVITIVRTFEAAGEQADIPVDVAGEIVEAEILADASGDAVVEVWRATDGGFPTFARIDGTGVPTLSSQQRVKNATLTGWSAALSAGDTLRYVVASVGVGVARVTMALKVLVSG